MKTIGLIVNPVAGRGGPAGMKGTDRPESVARADALGICPPAPLRAQRLLERVLRESTVPFALYAAPGEMGETAAQKAGLAPHVVGRVPARGTTAQDTKRIAREMRQMGVQLLLFCGGDGTARDICEAVGDTQLVLGIPSGVKMHSAVFALHTSAAAKVVAAFLQQNEVRTQLQEVMDIDEAAYARGEVSACLHGYLRLPCAAQHIQGLKTGSGLQQGDTLAAVVADMRQRMAQGVDRVFCIGAGGTTMALKKAMGLDGSLLGVDVVQNGRLLHRDADSRLLEELVQTHSVSIVVSPIGGQGFLFGRGNQQFTPAVLRRVGKNGIHVLCTAEKLAALRGRPLLVDTGSDETNQMLYGYVRVITGYHAEVVYRIAEVL